MGHWFQDGKGCEWEGVVGMILFEVIVPYACRSCQICLRASLCHTSHKKSQIYNIFRPLFTPTNSIVSYLMLNLENSRVIFCSIFRYTRFNFLTIISVTVAYASRKATPRENPLPQIHQTWLVNAPTRITTNHSVISLAGCTRMDWSHGILMKAIFIFSVSLISERLSWIWLIWGLITGFCENPEFKH